MNLLKGGGRGGDQIYIFSPFPKLYRIDIFLRLSHLLLTKADWAPCIGISKQIQDPTNNFPIHERGVSSGDHSFDAHADGKYVYCFSNEHWSAATKEVSFNVHGIVYVPESEVPGDPLEIEGKPFCTFFPWRINGELGYFQWISSEKEIEVDRLMVDMILKVKKLSELLAQVRDEQSYIVVRERTHRNTAESTNGRVKWWSIFQLGVLLGEGIFQVWWLKRFFEVS